MVETTQESLLILDFFEILDMDWKERHERISILVVETFI